MGDPSLPHARVWHLPDGATVEQRLQPLELTVVVDGGLSRSDAEERIRAKLADLVREKNGEPPLGFELLWYEKPTLLINEEGESEPDLVTAFAYFYERPAF